MKVFVSSVIDAPIEQVWMLVRDFNALPQWIPLVRDSAVEGGRASDSVGCIRNFNQHDGINIREQLLSLSDSEHRFSYSMLESGLGLYDYVSEFSLTRVTDGDRTFVTWTAEFRADPGREQQKAELVANGVFQRAFDSLKHKLDRAR